ncbi:MAG: VWA domain-containing protein [Desulfosudaceae bacterium]
MMFRLADPWYLLLLALLPVMAVYVRKYQRQPVMAVSDTRTAEDAPVSFWAGTLGLVRTAAWLTPALLILALARPQWGTEKIKTMTEGINIVLAVDVSRSMSAFDFKAEGEVVNRLTAVKSVVSDFIAGRTGDRLGLVVFGTSAFTQVPLTRDYRTIAFILDRLEIGAAGDNTAIGDAIGISIKRLRDIDSKSNIIILLTDGQSNAGEMSPEEATALAAEEGIKIHTIGVGSRGRAPFLVDHPLLGRQYVYRQVNMDEAVLKRIAGQTGGLYFRAGDTDALKRIYDTIDDMEKTTARVYTYANYRDLYGWLIGAALLLLLLRVIAENTRYLEVP